ncbi:fumarylacetoacetate hydrolase family protein [Burkholderiales bacterium]|nr:fumarylacetoacetate hydrolase family protein [Burkholderiales bacterium]MDA9994149.1 fumarylacetoacetate hydrolase family protein [Burkholderiales bacterium]
MGNKLFAFEPKVAPRVPIIGDTRQFPVNRIFCVGRNYAEHAREMGNDPDRDPPFFFLKSLDSLVPGGGSVSYPRATDDLHHEIEMVVAIGVSGSEIAKEDAQDHVFGYAVGLDLTRRDLQSQAKKMKRPWDFGKSFEQAAPITAITQTKSCEHLSSGEISLTVNDKVQQIGNLNEMIWNVPEIISFLSQFYQLEAGDLIFTGTPAGVGPLHRGDKLIGRVASLPELVVNII